MVILSFVLLRVKKENMFNSSPFCFGIDLLVLLDRMQFQNLFKNFSLLVLPS